ncbi:hypothetical protein [Simkania sp.]|uniref:hypothetical protein n=1 Tax=Simkania sp. TaxID=34094 RepID=UPI003B5293EB
MALEGVTNAVGPYATQFTDFVSRNWTAFKNASVEYGTAIWNSGPVQKVVEFTSPYFNKAAAYYPEWAKFSWSTGTAVATLGASVLLLALIGYWTGGSTPAGGRTAH